MSSIFLNTSQCSNTASVSVVSNDHSELHSTAEKAEAKTEGKKAGKDAPPEHLGWDSHTAVVSGNQAYELGWMLRFQVEEYILTFSCRLL